MTLPFHDPFLEHWLTMPIEHEARAPDAKAPKNRIARLVVFARVLQYYSVQRGVVSDNYASACDVANLYLIVRNELDLSDHEPIYLTEAVDAYDEMNCNLARLAPGGAARVQNVTLRNAAIGHAEHCVTLAKIELAGELVRWLNEGMTP